MTHQKVTVNILVLAALTCIAGLVYKASGERRPTEVYNHVGQIGTELKELTAIRFDEIDSRLSCNLRSILLADTVDSASIGFIACDSSFNTVWVSDGMERMCGRQICVGTPPYWIIPEKFLAMHKSGSPWKNKQPTGVWVLVTPEEGGGFVRDDGIFVPGIVCVQKVNPDESGVSLLAMIVPVESIKLRAANDTAVQMLKQNMPDSVRSTERQHATADSSR